MKSIQQKPNFELCANLGIGLIAGCVTGTVIGMVLGAADLGFMVGVILGLILAGLISRRELPMRYPPRLIRRIFLAVAFFLLTFPGYILLSAILEGSLVAVLLPTIGGVVLVYSLGAAIASLDEMQRRIQTEAISIGFAGTAIAIVPLALWNQQGNSPLQWVFLILAMVTSWAIGKFWVKRRYG
jgi:drug/metabolite transporter (DMT)-like permease